MTATSPEPGRLQRLRRSWANHWKSHLGTLLMVLAMVVGIHLWQTRDVPTGAVPELAFTLLEADGSQRRMTLAEWRERHPGQAVALHVWAEWCPICRAEEHNIQRLIRSAPVLSIAMQSGPPDAVARVLRQRGHAWPTAVDPRGELARALGVRSVPAFVTLDDQGRLRAASVGYTSELGMRARLWWAGRF